jgi:hypothetical protein
MGMGKTISIPATRSRAKKLTSKRYKMLEFSLSSSSDYLFSFSSRSHYLLLKSIICDFAQVLANKLQQKQSGAEGTQQSHYVVVLQI